MAWDPAQYLKFADHRLRPALDLLARIDAATPRRVVDLGCGTGNVTAILAQRWPAATVGGVDASETMLARAREEHPALSFVAADVATWAADPAVDVLYSNAALHWLGDHDSLFPHLFRQVAPGGWLAVQMPRNFGAPSHTAVADAARDGPWADRIVPMLAPPPVDAPGVYAARLAPLASSLDIWETEYLQILDGENPVAEWTKGTWLRPFLDALEEPDRSGFEAAYRARVAAAYPPGPDGRTAFPFRRLFLVARRAQPGA
ncbi:methyltransferase domain-containing protein [Thalassobaculum sp.]|uniref:methyltransferase domain-containing protein n=1 Tax=Thalassobaculum sp. TaxID=2022740 RepID=UPI0032EAC863